MPIRASILTLCALTLSTLPASAEPTLPTKSASMSEQRVVFDDDLLNADLSAPLGANVFAVHLPPARTRLIRPRAHFVTELLRSVEQL